MKILRLLTFLLAIHAGAASAQTPPVRILPLGDSITFGTGAPGGYRNKLHALLTADGYNVDFVGVQTGNPVASLPDPDHQGIGGWRIDQVDADIPKWLGVVADPDVILLHIGTNDFGQGLDTVNAINRFDALITKLARQLPYAHLVVANLMERGEPANATILNQFNPFVVDRVNAQAALGRRVTFLDMRAAVPLAEMPDNLHPGQAGYDHMAEAWAPAVKAVIPSPLGDAAPPAIARVTATPADRTRVDVTFSKPVADTAANLANFTLSGGLTISSAVLDSVKRTVTLTTSPQAVGTAYTLTVNGVSDRTPAALNLPANTTFNFFAPTPRGFLNNVPESAGFTLAYSLDIPAAANYRTVAPAYAANHSASIGPVNRIAYYIELRTPTSDLHYLWASLPAFTTEAGKLGVPVLGTGAEFQTGVAGMTVASNVAGILTGTNLAGNLEFWPRDALATRPVPLPGASDTLFDFGDTPTAGNYGSMQLHNSTAGQTLFAFNNWGGNPGAGEVDLGIGNHPAPVNAGLDWTFANNSSDYLIRSLSVLVKTDADTTPPALAAARASFGRSRVTVTFAEPVLASSVSAAGFTLDQGVLVLAATLAANQRDVILTTTAQPAVGSLTLSVSGVRDTSSAANRIAAGSTIVVGPAVLPAAVTANVGAAAAGYELVLSLDIPVTGNLNTLGAAAYAVDDRLSPGGFSRVAYYMELQDAAGSTRYAWASMDAFTASRGKLGVPTLATGAVFRQDVNNLEVQSNVPGIINGTTATGGNIEFWPSNYSAANGLAVPNASATTYDFGDSMTATTAGHGSMQIHNHDAGAAQTVMALNRFGVDGQTLELGIGNNPAPVNQGVDWTFAANAGSFTKRTLHVMVLPAATYFQPGNVAANAGAAANGYQHVYSLPIPATGNLASLVYSTNNSADVSGFSRIAYYMELQTGAAPPEWVWASMDAFTTDARRIGLPTAASGAIWQQKVANMEVLSNKAGIVTGTTVDGGNIEFWPNSYTAPNALPIPGASATAFDFGDTRSTTGTHGSMQLHNHKASQTLFALNNWATTTGTLSYALGIGNDPNTGRTQYNPDWTFAANAASYSSRLLHVFVLPGNPDNSGPAVARVTGSPTLNRLTIMFNEPVAESAAATGNFAVSGGVTVTGVRAVSPTEIALTTSPQTAGTVYTVTLSGIRDRSPLGNLSLPGASGTFTAPGAVALLSGIPEAAGFQLLYALPITNASSFATTPVTYSVDESRFPQVTPYNRLAWLLEVSTGGPSTWVWVSCDPFTTEIGKIGVPTFASGAIFQQNLTNMNVAASAGAPVTPGTGFSTGNIEFWPHNYSAPNAAGVPNASATLYDWGDTRATTGAHGSMQIHNSAAAEVLFAYNNWNGGTAGGNSSLGIGNDPAPVSSGLDWTFHNNAAAYTVKNLYVLGRPGGTALGTGPVILGQPLPRVAAPGQPVSFVVTLTTPGPFLYQWRRAGVPLEGQTSQWLDLPPVTAADANLYDCVITGAGAATTTSNSALLTVSSGSQPVFGATPDLAFATTDPAGMAVTFATPAASDNGPTPPVVACVPASGSPFPIGATTVTCTATGTSGATSTRTFVVTVSLVSSQDSTISGQPGTAISVQFRGITGKSYLVQRSPDLNGWTTLATVIAGPDGAIPATDHAPLPGRGFYRAVPAPQ